MKSYTVWFVGTLNKYQVYATDRKDALLTFAEAQGVIVSSYLQARKTRAGEYLLLETGAYGVYQAN